jgi:hypothetical protein
MPFYQKFTFTIPKEYPRKILKRKTLSDDLKIADNVAFEKIQFPDNRHKIHPKSYTGLKGFYPTGKGKVFNRRIENKNY